MRDMLNREERNKAEIIGMCLKGRITAKDAAQRLKLSVRQVEILCVNNAFGYEIFINY